MSITLAGVRLKNPVIAASGTVGYGQELAKKTDLNALGALVIKSTTAEPRTGNPWPTTTNTTAGWLNAVGLKNPGIKNVMTEKLPWLATHYPDLPIVGSVAGGSMNEYVEVAKQLTTASNVKFIEVNVSCPNVDHGGLAFGTDPATVQTLTAKIVTAVDKPVFVKLTPNVTDIVPIAKAAEAGGAAGLVLINTLLGMEIDLATQKPRLAHGTGGLSGQAIHPLAVYMVHQVRQASTLPIVGVGGVFTSKDAVELMLAGANAVQVGAATFHDPASCANIAANIPATLAEYDLTWPSATH
ncbi:dihydroorotate dehydrogenase [Furfurilactobacillus milii]|uniref:Dihydroorotate dehydrogenase n=1 Tax=Furfurilactobacillus milii TaxID=2888272 RepID=A0A6N9HZW2_9LACO|nr:dihydroorotate dehydrogenase [Furfurilactobacillus milii]MYV16027.1 dihydroorotate dehydrogenase [Furfurilactobacillus milii]